MLVKCLAVVLLATMAVAEMPDFMPICGRRNPNLSKCVLDATNALREKLKAGIPEIGLPPQDPLQLKEFTISDTDALKASARDVTIKGMGDFVVESMNVDLKAREFSSVMRFKKIILDGNYDINSMIVLPISGQGPIHIESNDVVTDILVKYNLVKINGAEHIRYASVTTSLAVKSWTALFTPSATMDSNLAKAINAALETGRNEIFESFKPNVEKVISQITMDVANKVNEQFTYDELFPDRE